MKKFLAMIIFLFMTSCVYAGEIKFNVVVNNLSYADRAIWVSKIGSLPASYVVENVSYIETDDIIFGKKGQMTFGVTIQNVAENQLDATKTRIVNMCTGYFVVVTNFHYKEDGI